MVTLTEVKRGEVTLADLAQITNYLNMKSDIEFVNMPQPKKNNMRRGLQR